MDDFRLGRGPRAELGEAIGVVLTHDDRSWGKMRERLVDLGWTPVELLAEMDAREIDGKWRWENGIDAILDPASGYWGAF